MKMHSARNRGRGFVALVAAVLGAIGLGAACRAADPDEARVVVVPPRPDASFFAPDVAVPGEAGVDAGRPVLPAPAGVVARAVSPYAVEVRWEWPAGGPPVNGFEVLAVRGAGEARLGLANPQDRVFRVHRLLPEDRLELRVRAFAARGTSRREESVVVTTPKDGPKRAVATLPPCVPPVKVAPATTGGCNPGLEVLDATTGLVNVPSAGDACRRRLLATYKGCTRELGAFELQADVTEVPGHPTDGFPLLHAIAGAGEYVGAQILTLAFDRGRYVVVDTAMFCGEPYPDAPPSMGTVDPDVTKCRPPFEVCQHLGNE